MTLAELLRFMRTHRFAVEASCGSGGGAQAALVGIAVTDAFEIVFDTLATTRKAQNLRASPRAAFVLGGWGAADERTVQLEGIADEPVGAELERIKAAYFAAWPDGPTRASWPDLTYFRVRPTWIRFSDYNEAPPRVIEFSSDHLVRELADEHRNGGVYFEAPTAQSRRATMMENMSESQGSHRWYARPVLFVADVNRAARFYVEMLGFDKGWHEGDGAGKVCQVNHGECEIILCEDASRRDRGRLFIELTPEGLSDLSRGLVERSVPTRETWWGQDALQVDDPDRNELFFPRPG